MPRWWFAIWLVCALAGCLGPAGPATAPSALPLALVPASADDGLPASIAVEIDQAPRTLLTLPTTWDTATVRLDNPATLLQPLARTLVKGTDLVAQGANKYKTAAAFGTLRPHANYTLLVDLWSGGSNGTLQAEASKTVTLAGGVNNVSVTLATTGALSISSASPSSAVVGTGVTLTGQGFSQLASQDLLSLGGVSATVSAATNTTLTTSVPSLAPGLYSWNVNVGSSSASLAGFGITANQGGTLPWSFGTSHQSDPALCFGGGQYLLAWTDDQPSPNTNVLVQRVDTTGARVGSPVVANSTSGANQQPWIAYNPNLDQFLVVWVNGKPGKLVAQLFNADGTPAGANQALNNSATADSMPRAWFDPSNNQFGVVWADSSPGQPTIFGILLANTGAPATGSGALVTPGNPQNRPAIAFSSSAVVYCVAWEETIGTQTAIRAVVERPNATVVGSIFGVDTAAGLPQTAPALAVDPATGDFLLAWADTSGTPGLKAQRISATTGAPVGSVIAVGDGSGTKAGTRIAYEPWQSKFVVVWEDDRRGGNWDVLAQYVGLDGTQYGGNWPVRQINGAQGACAVAADPGTPRSLVAIQDPTLGPTIVGQPIR